MPTFSRHGAISVWLAVAMLVVGCSIGRDPQRDPLPLDEERAYLAELLDTPPETIEGGRESVGPSAVNRTWTVLRPESTQHRSTVVTIHSRLAWYSPGDSPASAFPPTGAQDRHPGPLTREGAVEAARALARRAWLFDDPDGTVVGRILRETDKSYEVELTLSSESPRVPGLVRVTLDPKTGLCWMVMATNWPGIPTTSQSP
ncbi:MAG: hypothetical protein HPY69_19815 [Armatimonadetes bacterium]|nr:hypothetical protein [Armatimonadota bacterium]